MYHLLKLLTNLITLSFFSFSARLNLLLITYIRTAMLISCLIIKLHKLHTTIDQPNVRRHAASRPGGKQGVTDLGYARACDTLTPPVILGCQGSRWNLTRLYCLPRFQTKRHWTQELRFLLQMPTYFYSHQTITLIHTKPYSSLLGLVVVFRNETKPTHQGGRVIYINQKKKKIS